MTVSIPSVLVVDENKIRAAIIEAGLLEAGYEQVHVIGETLGLARYIEQISPDVIVIDLENPNRDLLESMFQLSRTVKRPIAMFVDQSDQTSIEAAVEAGVSAYIVDGLTKERVKPILDMAISRFNAFAHAFSLEHRWAIFPKIWYFLKQPAELRPHYDLRTCLLELKSFHR